MSFGLFGYLRYKIHDDSTYEMWTMRHSIDIMIRLNVCIVTAVWLMLRLLIITKSGYKSIYQNNLYYKSIMFAGVSLLTELVYYLTSIYFHIHHHPQNDVVSHFRLFWHQFRQQFILYWISVFLLGYTFY